MWGPEWLQGLSRSSEARDQGGGGGGGWSWWWAHGCGAGCRYLHDGRGWQQVHTHDPWQGLLPVSGAGASCEHMSRYGIYTFWYTLAWVQGLIAGPWASLRARNRSWCQQPAGLHYRPDLQVHAAIYIHDRAQDWIQVHKQLWGPCLSVCSHVATGTSPGWTHSKGDWCQKSGRAHLPWLLSPASTVVCYI